MKNEELKRLLSTLRIDGNLRVRLQKIFDKAEPVLEIDLRGREYGRQLIVTKDDVEPLMQVCRAIDGLEVFAIVGDYLDQEAMTQLAENIRGMVKLRILHIEGEIIEWSPEMSSALKDHPALQSIYLYSDNLQDDTVLFMTRVLGDNHRIKRLSIGGKKTKEEEIQTLLKFGVVGNLEQLSLTCERLSLDSCKIVGEQLAGNTSLQVFVIEADRIDGIDFLMDGIKINHSLSKISIFGDSWEEEDEERVKRELDIIVKRNKSGEDAKLMGEVLAFIHSRLHLRTEYFDTEAISLLLGQIGEDSVGRREMAIEEISAIAVGGGGGAGASGEDRPDWIRRPG